jgi:hypothetical protein
VVGPKRQSLSVKTLFKEVTDSINYLKIMKWLVFFSRLLVTDALVGDGQSMQGRGRGVLYQRDGQRIKRMKQNDPLNPVNPLTGSKINL